ncbi:Hypothetical_protein [Hexamita inflata]|uniref:Hypothetical_protein n=1 Tax=Hexamita inflata TaxID=28002 RepID=A0AA86QGQ0_9EUKA|nr:Hypothetical protein HINF_LOCUS43587 [Hexamita inflata]
MRARNMSSMANIKNSVRKSFDFNFQFDEIAAQHKIQTEQMQKIQIKQQTQILLPKLNNFEDNNDQIRVKYQNELKKKKSVIQNENDYQSQRVVLNMEAHTSIEHQKMIVGFECMKSDKNIDYQDINDFYVRSVIEKPGKRPAIQYFLQQKITPVCRNSQIQIYTEQSKDYKVVLQYREYNDIFFIPPLEKEQPFVFSSSMVSQSIAAIYNPVQRTSQIQQMKIKPYQKVLIYKSSKIDGLSSEQARKYINVQSENSTIAFVIKMSRTKRTKQRENQIQLMQLIISQQLQHIEQVSIQIILNQCIPVKNSNNIFEVTELQSRIIVQHQSESDIQMCNFTEQLNSLQSAQLTQSQLHHERSEQNLQIVESQMQNNQLINAQSASELQLPHQHPTIRISEQLNINSLPITVTDLLQCLNSNTQQNTIIQHLKQIQLSIQSQQPIRNEQTNSTQKTTMDPFFD